MGRILNNEDRKALHIERKANNQCVDCGIDLEGHIPDDDDFFPLCKHCAIIIMKEIDEKKLD